MLHDPSIYRLRMIATSILACILASTIGYHLIEGWSWVDSAYMAIITFSTVGYGEPYPPSELGKAFSCVVIICAIISMTCWTAFLTSFVVERDLGGHFLRKRMRVMIRKLRDHVVICGDGLMAEAVIERMMNQGKSVVLVASPGERLDFLRSRFRKLFVVEGHGSEELNLAEANVIHATAVVAAMESEVDNLLVSITCRDLSEEIQVFARSNDPTIGNRMRKALVDEVISPCQICGDRVADLILDQAGGTQEEAEAEPFDLHAPLPL